MTVRVGLIGGSGLYALEGLAAAAEVRLETPWGEPSDAFLVGELSGVPVAFLARHGRGHRIPPSSLNFRANVWGFRMLGCDALISTSACGSMKEAYRPADVVLPDQFVDMTRGRASTFFDDGCVAHVSMADPVCPALLRMLERAGRETGASLHAGGTYLCIDGPQFSSRAESNLYRSWGVDVVGMTNATEAKLCREAEVCYASLAMVTDYDCWREGEEALSVEVLLGILKKNEKTSAVLVRAAIAAVAGLTAERPCRCRQALGLGLVTLPEDVPPASRERLTLLTERYWK